MVQKNSAPEIRNDIFYFKKMQEEQPISYAYLHLADKADETFLAVFEKLEATFPSVYWWKESNANAEKESRQVITSLIGEAYISCTYDNLMDKPLWSIAQLENAIIPAEWRKIVKSINRENYGSRK